MLYFKFRKTTILESFKKKNDGKLAETNSNLCLNYNSKNKNNCAMFTFF